MPPRRSRSRDPRGRAEAIQEAGRALALDPEDDDAQQLLARLVMIEPDDVPAPARASAELERAAARQAAMRAMSHVFAAFVFAIATLLLFSRAIVPIVAQMAANALTGLLCWRASRQPLPRGARPYHLAIWSHAASLAAGCLVFGPLLLMPLFVLVSAIGALIERTTRSAASVLVPYGVAIAVPLGLEWLGALPASYTIRGGSIVFTPPALDLAPGPTLFVVVFSIVSSCLLIAYLLVAQRRVHEAAQDRLHATSWHLRQLLPDSSRRDG